MTAIFAQESLWTISGRQLIEATLSNLKDAQQEEEEGSCGATSIARTEEANREQHLRRYELHGDSRPFFSFG